MRPLHVDVQAPLAQNALVIDRAVPSTTDNAHIPIFSIQPYLHLSLNFKISPRAQVRMLFVLSLFPRISERVVHIQAQRP